MKASRARSWGWEGASERGGTKFYDLSFLESGEERSSEELELKKGASKQGRIKLRFLSFSFVNGRKGALTEEPQNSAPLGLFHLKIVGNAVFEAGAGKAMTATRRNAKEEDGSSCCRRDSKGRMTLITFWMKPRKLNHAT
ncbi:hypothetical protein NL676_018324 [Syzygium grande]|nr:hypothetical protein NL676_018324 [Syzygium grande]